MTDRSSTNPGGLGSWRGESKPRRSPAAMSVGSWSDDEAGAPGSGETGSGNKLLDNNKRSNLDLGSGSKDHNRRPYSPVAETLFRKDLISAMKLPDNEPLEVEDYWTVTDTWKQEWERGVQVPVRPEGLPEAHVDTITPSSKSERFALPKKLICMNTSGSYKAETHQVTPMVLRADQVCTYDLDNVDQTWLGMLNGERAQTGLSNLTETEMERTIEELEKQCWDKINTSLRNSDDMDIAQDDSIICDVCRSPDSEESNEMVFCDQCNICVHQACYGITTIPSGSWLCRTCTLGIKPPCELCPNKGGAMKSTRTGQKWAHVSCALWIPEVSIGCVEKMEPITKISSIPPSRWSLVCVLCKERNVGSCIQCSVKTCKTAYHVTCAFKHNLEMCAIIEDENAEDGVKLRSYCQKHSLNPKKKSIDDSDSESGIGGPVGRKSNMTKEEKSQARRQRMAKVEKEFYKLVDIPEAAKKIDLSDELVDIVFKYWTLKRVAGGNKPLLPPKGEDESLSALRGEDTERDKMKMLVSVRQDLERVRNLAYMVSRREKMSRSFVKLKEQILEKQLALLADEEPSNQMSLMEMSAVCEANHGPTIYDRFYSNPDAEPTTSEDFEAIICRIAGEIKEGSSQIRKDNPLRKKSTDVPLNSNKTVPYERIFSDTSQSESDDSFIQNVKPDFPRRSSIDKKKKKGPDKKGSLKSSKSMPSSKKPVTRSDSSMSSSEEEDALKNMLSPQKRDVSANNMKNIYSDSDSDRSVHEKTPPKRGRPPKKQKLKETKSSQKTESGSEVRAGSEDTQNSTDRPKEFRTKAALKEFTAEDMALAKKIMEDKQKGHENSSESNNKLKRPIESKPSTTKSSSDDDSVMEIDPNDIDLNDINIVPQRSAARKAEQKMSKTSKDPPSGIVDLKKAKSSKSSGLFGTSDDDSRDAKDGKSKKLESVSDSCDDLSNKMGRKSPRQSSANKKKQTSTDSESEEEVSPRSQKLPKQLSKSSTKKTSNSDEIVILSSKNRKTSSPVRKAEVHDNNLSDNKISPKDHKHKSNDSSEEDQENVKSSKSGKNFKAKQKSIPVTKNSKILSDSEEDIFEKKVRERKKSGSKKKKSKGTTSDSEDELIKMAKLSSVLSNKQKKLADFDDLISKDDKAKNASGSESESDKKKFFDDFEHPVVPAFVPQRRAAKKASAQLSEQNLWRKTQQEAYLAELAQIQEQKELYQKNLKKQKSRKSSPSKASSGSDTGKKRLRSSDSASSSDDSDRAKSPRGRGKSPKGKSKSKKPQSKKIANKSKVKTSPKVKTDGKIMSAKALEYLMERESQISSILGEFEKESKQETDRSTQDPPDKKLKTSEGRPDGIQSPPVSTKDSSDSGSGSDSEDSVIRAIEDRKKKEAEDKKPRPDPIAIMEIEKETDTKSSPIELSNPEKRSPKAAGQSKQSVKEPSSTDPITKDLNDRQSRGRTRNSSDISMEQSGSDMLPGTASREGGSSSRERSSKVSRTTTSQGQQLKQTTPRESPNNKKSPAQKKSIFSPDRSPRPSPDQGRSRKSSAVGTPENFKSDRSSSAQRERDSSREKENEGPSTWKSPQERRQTEPGAHGSQIVDKVGREIPSTTKSPSKSPALSRTIESSRSSPMQSHRSPAFGRSPARHSQHPLNKSLDLNKSLSDSFDSSKLDLNDVNKAQIANKDIDKSLNKSDNEPEEERPSIESRKFSVESKDSDGDSAKSSLPDANINGLPDFSKEDSTDTLDYGDKLSDLRDTVNKGKEQKQTLSKTDEGYVSAEKVQNNDINAQDNFIKGKEVPNFLPNFQTNVTGDKSSHIKEADKVNSTTKTNIRLSTDESVSSIDLGLPKSSNHSNSAWSELQNITQASGSIPKHLLDDPRLWQMHQQHHAELGKQQQKHDTLTNSNDKKVSDALAAKQHQAQYEQFLKQMSLAMQVNAGHELSQQQMAYAQKYMQEFGYGSKGLEFQALNQNFDLLSQQINYQNISNQMNNINYQHYVQQMQQAYGLNKKVLDQNDLTLVAWQAQQQELQAADWYQRQLGLDKIGDLEKMTQGGLRELEKMALNQAKDKSANPATSSTQERLSFMDKEIRLQEQEKRLLEEKRVQEEKRLKDDKRKQEEKRKRDEEERKREDKRRAEEQRKVAEEQRKKMEEEQQRLAEEHRKKLEEEQRKREEEERLKEDKRRAEEQRKIAEEKRKKYEEEQRKKYEEEQRKIAEEKRKKYEEEQRKIAEEKRKKYEEEQRKIADEKIAEEKRKKHEEEQRKIAEEKRRKMEEEQKRIAEEKKKKMEEEQKRIAEEKRKEEERIRKEEEERKQKEEEEQKRKEEERKRIEEEERKRKEEEERKRKEEEERKRKEEEQRIIAEELLKKKEEEERRIAEELRKEMEEEQNRLAEELRKKKEEEDMRIAEELRKQYEEEQRILAEELKRKKEEEERRIAEENRKREEDEKRKLAEEQRRKYEEEQRVIAEEYQRQVEEEQRRVALEQQRKIEEEQQRIVEEQRRMAEELEIKLAEEKQQKLEEEQKKLAEEQEIKLKEEKRKIAEKQQQLLEQQRIEEEERLLEEQRITYERFQGQFYDSQKGEDYLRQQQDILTGYGNTRHTSNQDQYLHGYGPREVANQLFGGEKSSRDLVGHVEDQLGALTGAASSLFGLNKDQNSNQEKTVPNSLDLFSKGNASKPITKSSHKAPSTISTRSGRCNSPRQDKNSLSSCQLDPDLIINQQYGIPSATPEDKLPGFTPSISSRDHKRQSNESHADHQDTRTRDIVGETRRGRDTTLSAAGSEISHNSAPTGIPNELLDSILETAKLPVWKPPDKGEGQQGFSPAKPPMSSPSKPAPVTSERDSSFDDLVRHIDSSPSQKENNKPDDKSSKHNIPTKELFDQSLNNAQANRSFSDHASASEAERSDYDNDNFDQGGVDYDDPDDELPLGKRIGKQHKKSSHQHADISTWSQNKLSPTKHLVNEDETPESVNEDRPAETLTKRGTKVPCYAEKTEDEFDKKKEVAQVPSKVAPTALVAKSKSKNRPNRGGVFGGRRGGLKYDQKAFEKVHKNLAGTDFDFVNEFDDDFGATPIEKEMPTSLKGFRDQTKKAPIYMQEKVSDNSFEFEDVESNNAQVPPVIGIEDDDDDDDIIEIPPPSEKSISKVRAKAPPSRRNNTREPRESPEPPQLVEEDKLTEIKQVTQEEEHKEIPKVIISLKKHKEDSSISKIEEDQEIITRRSRRGIKQMKATSVSRERLMLKSRESAPTPHIIDSDDDDLLVKDSASLIVQRPLPKKDDSQADPDFKIDKSKPKIPTLKIKLGRTDSPVSIGSDDGEKSKKVRQSSFERAKDDNKDPSEKVEDGTQQRIPKLKIRLGAPKSKAPDPPAPEVTAIPSPPDINTSKNIPSEEPPPLIIRTAPSSSPLANKAKTTPTQSSKSVIPVVDLETGERLSTSELALEAIKTAMKAEAVKSSPKSQVTQPPSSLAATSNMSSKQKPKSIDSLANQLLAKQQTTSVPDESSSELQNIFGPEEPLQHLNLRTEVEESSTADIERGDEGPSELELLAMELNQQLAKEKQLKQQAEEAANMDEEEVLPQNTSEALDFEEELQHHDPKYKFKHLNKPSQHGSDGGRNTTSPGPTTPVKINLTQSSVVDSNPLRRMRKKELLNQYYGIEEPVAPAQLPVTNGPSVSVVQEQAPQVTQPSNHRSSEGGSSKYERHREPVRMNIIKMPKAVASVTSVPTRADYQSQLEANLERKRKREGKEDPKLKKKGGKGRKQKDEWEEPYKPKIKMNQIEGTEGESDHQKEVRKTRGKPIKKCLAVDDSPERDPVESFIENKKNESLKFAEEMLKSFDQQEDKPDRERRRKERKEKRKRRDAEDDVSQPNTKTPRIVIKFSKNPPKNVTKDGLIKPTQAPKQVESEAPKKLPKLKIKNLIEPSKT